MVDKVFLAKINILYVEDDSSIVKNVAPIFKKLFNIAVGAVNGKEGIEKYKSQLTTDEPFDIIVTDINMPEVSGLEMISEIRENNLDIPIILTTAFSEPKYFKEAIKNKIINYVNKPIDMKLLLLEIQDAVKNDMNKKLLYTKKIENERYIDIINKIAIVAKTNTQGNFTFVNNIFCEISGYSSIELIGKSEELIRHENTDENIYMEIWETIKSGYFWKGKMKHKTKNDGYFFVNTTIFPIFDNFNKIIEFMSVSFVITEDENEKRKFKKKVMLSMKENNLTQSELKNSNEILKQKVFNLEKELNLEHSKMISLENEVLIYKKELRDIKISY